MAKDEWGVCSSCLSLVIFVPSRFCGGQLVCRIFFTCHGPGDGDTQVPKLIAQTAAGDAQNLGCLNLVAAGMLQHLGQEGFFHPAQTVLIKILRGEAKLFVNEAFKRAPERRGRNGASGFQFINGLREKIGEENRARGMKKCVFENVLQLAHITRPGVVLQSFQCRRRNPFHMSIQLAVEPPQIMMNEER